MSIQLCPSRNCMASRLGFGRAEESQDCAVPFAWNGGQRIAGSGARGAVADRTRALALDAEVARLRMVQHNGAGALLGPELVFFGQLDADALRAQEFEELRLVGEIWAGGIAEAVARAAITLL